MAVLDRERAARELDLGGDGVAPALWERAFLVRTFEERLLSLFAEKRINGTVHTCVGQEWSAVAVTDALNANDVVFSNHRGHGHYLSLTDRLEPLLAEILGRAGGLCGGVGGSQHLYDEQFLTNGIQGGMTPIAAGRALGMKRLGNGGICVAFIGDGTTGEGILYETLNLASLFDAPLLLVLEHNGVAQSTATHSTIAGTIAGRAAAFGIDHIEANTWNVPALLATAQEAVDRVRSRQSPLLLEIHTYRLNAHSKGDDDRDPEEVSAYFTLDPLQHLAEQRTDDADRYAAQAAERVEQALASVEPTASCTYEPTTRLEMHPARWRVSQPAGDDLYVTLIHRALAEAFDRDERVMLLGEDVAAPYGGAFKVSRDLSQRYPDRVWNMPIAEAGMVGLGTGLALAGFRPVVEIMFGDFLTLAFDQLQQHAGKFAAMSNGKCEVPMLVRTPMGGGRGYGPTHSQSIEKHFLGISGIDMVVLNKRVSPLEVYARLFESLRRPTLVIENKRLYTQRLGDPLPAGYTLHVSDESFPCARLSVSGQKADVTVWCSGGALHEVERALESAFYEDEILCEVLCPTQVQPLNLAPVIESVSRSGRLLTVEEGPGIAGFGAELCARLAEQGAGLKKFKRLFYDGVIPCCLEQERQLLPNPASIQSALREVIHDA